MAYVAAGEAPRPERPAAPSMRQLIEIADAAWQWEVIDEVPNDTIDEILDRLRVALKGYRPRHIHPALMQVADRVIRERWCMSIRYSLTWVWLRPFYRRSRLPEITGRRSYIHTTTAARPPEARGDG
jgi:hypothetical protein